MKLVQILSLAGKGDVNLRVDLRTRTADGALTYDTQEGATILLEVERRLYALVESNNSRPGLRRELSELQRMVSKAIAWEDDEPCHGCTDD